jgi:Domain of unknown function (DUF6970)
MVTPDVMGKMIMRRLLIISIIALFHFSTSVNAAEKIPNWLNLLIAKYNSEQVGDPPREIWQYEYKDKFVYYFPEQCCDLRSDLLNADGIKICSPDGGYAGAGDGKCMDFLSERKNGKLIWKDIRKPKKMRP